MGKQEGRTGQICLWISGAILIICGVACFAAAYAAVPTISGALFTACDSMSEVAGCLPCEQLCHDAYEEATKDLPAGSAVPNEVKETEEQCINNCTSSAEEFDSNKCLVDLKTEAQCICPNKDDHESCDCSDSALDVIQTYWELACLALGALGLVAAVLFTGLPALFAGTKYNKCVNACCYSVCSGIFSLLFIGMGALFIAIGLATSGPLGDELMAECKNQGTESIGEGAESTGNEEMDDAVNDMVDCAAEAFCSGMMTIVEDVGSKSTMVGQSKAPGA